MSMMSISWEKRFTSRPEGVVSKKPIGDRSVLDKRLWCRWVDASMAPNARPNEPIRTEIPVSKRRRKKLLLVHLAFSFWTTLDYLLVLTIGRMAAAMHKLTWSRSQATRSPYHIARIMHSLTYPCRHKVPERDSRVLTGVTVAQGTLEFHSRRRTQCPGHY